MKRIYQSTGLLKPMTIIVDFRPSMKQRVDAIKALLTDGGDLKPAQALARARRMVDEARR